MLETTTITDLDTDCMEAIFEFLEFDDLLSIAQSSDQFYTAVCEVYKRNYASRTVIYDPSSMSNRHRYLTYQFKLTLNFNDLN